MKTLRTGIQDGMSAEQYHALDLCSNSACNVIAQQSPAHLRYERANPKPPTPAMIEGSALHCLVLEPATFEERYVVTGQCEAVKRDGERCEHPGIHRVGGEWRCGTHSKSAERAAAGRVILTGQQYDDARRMRDSIYAHPEVGEAMRAPRRVEVANIWRDPETGILIKNLWDAPFIESRIMFDLKTAVDASTAGMQRACNERAYHTQCAMYLDGARESGVLFDRFVFVVVEKCEPFACRTLEASDGFIEWGRREYRERVNVYAQCEKSGVWPGYADELIEAPDYVVARERRKLAGAV
jgi:PDDEXK-like uncharacterized protein DUF3799